MSAVEQRPPITRLTKVELRKMVDTRAGFWLLFTTFGLCVLVFIILLATGSGTDVTNTGILSLAAMPATMLVPVLGVLLASSEFSVRSALTTFTVVPHRGRVVVAKFFAGLILSLLVSAALVLGTLLTGAFLSPPGGAEVAQQSGFGDMVGRTVLLMVLAMTSGLAFGLLLRNSALAIAAYFMLPTLLAIPFAVIRSIEKAGPWVTQERWGELVSQDGLSSQAWAQVGTSSLIWIVAMLAVGLWRLERSEIK